VSVLLRVLELRRYAEPEERRLLRVLFVRHGALPTDPGAEALLRGRARVTALDRKRTCEFNPPADAVTAFGNKQTSVPVDEGTAEI
jgi:hypothetical protein